LYAHDNAKLMTVNPGNCRHTLGGPQCGVAREKRQARTKAMSTSTKREGPPPFGSSPSIVEPRSLWTASSVASRRCPRKRQASRSCEPATAAEDNETLDHLLSFVAVMRAI
jgi:hypothetical protein